MKLPRVAYWNSQPTPYMVDRWNAVAENGNLDMHAWFNVERESDRSWDVDEATWKFNGRYLSPRVIAGRRLYLPPSYSETGDIDLVVQEYASASSIVGFLVSQGLSARVAFRALPTFDTWVRRRPHKEFLKHCLFRSVDAAKTGGPDGVSMFSQYGLPANRIFEVNQSIDVDYYSRATLIGEAESDQFRQNLSLSGCVFIYVGRLWKKKGLDDLFEAFESLQEEGDLDVSLLLVGDGVDENLYRNRASSLRNVAFVGFVQRDDILKYFAAADVLVFPTLGDPNGLVVEEAMAAGLPVISSDAAGDIRQRLPDREAGFVVPAASPDDLAIKMRELAANSALRIRMGESARSVAARSNLSSYVRDFEAFVYSVMESPKRRTPLGLGSRAVGKLIRTIH